MKIRWTPEAQTDLDSICRLIAEDSPDASLDVGQTLFAGIERLADFPYRGRPGLLQGTRELVFA